MNSFILATVFSKTSASKIIRYLREHETANGSELAEALKLPLREVERALEEIERKGRVDSDGVKAELNHHPIVNMNI